MSQKNRPRQRRQVLARVRGCRYGACTARRHTDFACQAILAKAYRLEKLLEEHYAGMDVGQFGHKSTSVVIDDLNLIGVSIRPDEADPPLLVDADTVLE